MKKTLFFFIYIILIGRLAFGQNGPTPAPSPTPPAPEPKKAADYQSMTEGTLAQDIETASYYELVAWCRLLKLDEAGDKAALVQRLMDFFKVKSASEKKEILKRIEIKSARSSEYFSLEDVKEDYVLIQGGVVIVLVDKKEGTEHSIQAERVLYNQTTGIISASGNVVYQRKVGATAEMFTGESFVYDVSNWEGLLYYAQGERSKKMDDTDVLFRYSGKTVTRMKDDSILLEQGVITSSANLENPHYRITADRIWVYAPGEWSIENAALFLGNIPVLYLPFFYYTSDEIFFNPVIGFNDRLGTLFTNTIYLYGKKKREEDAFSFLQVEGAEDQNTEMRLDGLFLRPRRKTPETGAETAAAPSETAPKTPTEAAQKAAAIKHLKLFIDFYSRLGGFVGVSLDATPIFKLDGGIAVTRSIFYDSANGRYTSYYLENDYWNSGYLFSLKTPFRFGLETTFKHALGLIQRIEGSLSLFSDPYFATDFYGREESQDWGKVLGFSLPTTETTTPSTTAAITRPNLTWTVDLGFNFATLLNSPLFQSLRLDPFKFTFDWASKTIVTVDPIVLADPSHSFYYPQRIIFPNMTLAANGTIAEYTYGSGVAPAPSASTPGPATAAPAPSAPVGRADLRLPFPAEEPAPTPAALLPDAPDLRRPDPKTDVPVNHTTRYFYFKLYYQLQHQIISEHAFSHENWTRVEDITYGTKNSNFDHTGSTVLFYQFAFWEAFQIKGSFGMADKFRTTYTPFIGFAQADSDKQVSALHLTNTLDLIYTPLLAFSDFKLTTLMYSLNWKFFDIVNTMTAPDYGFAEYSFQFLKETVSSNKLTADLVFQPEDKRHSLKLTAAIPPCTGLGSLRGDLDFHLWFFETIAWLEYKQQADESWRFLPLSLTERANLGDILTLSTSYSHDLEANTPYEWTGAASLIKYKYLNADHLLAVQSIKYNFGVSAFDNCVTTIDLWNLKTVITARYDYPQSAIGNGNKPALPKEFSLRTIDFSYALVLPSVYGWRNRIEFAAGFDTSLKLDFQNHLASSFKLSLNFNLKIYKFLDVVFKVKSRNNNVYRYIPGFVDAVNAELGVTTVSTVNLFEDLLRSFNFFNDEDRYASLFKLESIEIGFVHHLDDWDFSFSYVGNFQFVTLSSGLKSFQWMPAITFSLKWLGIPQIKKEGTGDSTGLQL